MTTKTRQVVRKTPAAPLADFDEQWWSITALLVAAAGLPGAVGISWAFCTLGR